MIPQRSITDEASSFSDTNFRTNASDNLEDLKFYDVIPTTDLICSLSKQVFEEPYLLVPCGHTFNRAAIVNRYLETKSKTCSTCAKPYICTVEHLFLKSVINSRHSKIIPTVNAIDQLYAALPESPDKVKIKESIDLFRKGTPGQVDRGILKMVEIITDSPNSELYTPILKLMEEQKPKVPNQASLGSVPVNGGVQATFGPVPMNRGVQASLAPLPGNGVLPRNSIPSIATFGNGMAPPAILPGQALNQIPSSFNNSSQISSLDMKFFEIVKKTDLICSVSKKNFNYPHLLVPCGHTFSIAPVTNKFLETRTKTCFTCLKTYTSIVENTLLKSIITKINLRMHSKVIEDFTKLYTALPISPEKLVIKQGFDGFISGHLRHLECFISNIAERCLKSPTGADYIPVLKLMEDNQQQVYRNTIQSTPESVPLPEIGVVQSSVLTAENSSGLNYSETLPRSTSQTPAVPVNSTASLSKKRTLKDSEEPPAKIARQNQANDVSTVRNNDVTTAMMAVIVDDTQITSFSLGNSMAQENENTDIGQDLSSNTIVVDMEDSNVVQAENSSASTTINTLIEGLKKKHTNVAKEMHDHNVNSSDADGNTPLHLVVLNYKRTINLITKLFEHKANLNAQNFNGDTPLHIAAQLKKLKTIQILRSLGASTGIKNNQGQYPLDIAKSSRAKNALYLPISDLINDQDDE